MMSLQNTCTKVMIKPQSLSNNATATGYIDTLGYDEAAVDFILDSQAGTTSSPTLMKLSEADTTDASNFSDISGLVGDATDGFVIQSVSSTVATIHRLNVDLRARKRYLRAHFTPQDAANICAVVATLGRAADSTVARSQMLKVVDG
jgi:hypothetical protein